MRICIASVTHSTYRCDCFHFSTAAVHFFQCAW